MIRWRGDNFSIYSHYELGAITIGSWDDHLEVYPHSIVSDTHDMLVGWPPRANQVYIIDESLLLIYHTVVNGRKNKYWMKIY